MHFINDAEIVVNAHNCLVCERSPRNLGQRFCNNPACAQKYIRACVYCRNSVPVKGYGKCCSLLCKQKHAFRVNTPKSLRKICRYFVTGNFKVNSCPHGLKCWDRHPPAVVVPFSSKEPIDKYLAVLVPSSHSTRFQNYINRTLTPSEIGNKRGFAFRLIVVDSFLQAVAGQRNTGRKANRLFVLGLQSGCKSIKNQKLLCKTILALAEDINLRLLLQALYPVQSRGFQLPSQACMFLRDQLLHFQSEKSINDSKIRVRIHGNPPDLVKATETWFGLNVSSKIEIVAQNFDYVASILYITDRMLYYVGIVDVSTKVAVGGLNCHCQFEHLRSDSSFEPCTKNMLVQEEYIRCAFLRKLWITQAAVCGQSHRYRNTGKANDDQSNHNYHQGVAALAQSVNLASAVSRAYWKLAEVFCRTNAWHNALLSSGDSESGVVALDLGASPGGWSYQVNKMWAMFAQIFFLFKYVEINGLFSNLLVWKLAERCKLVLAVDPGKLKQPCPTNVLHIAHTVQVAVAPPQNLLLNALGLDRKANICVCDINSGPAQTLKV